MKKSLIVVLSMIVALGLAVPVAVKAKAPAPADTPIVAKGPTKITLGGELRMRGWYLENHSGTRRGIGTPAIANSQGWFDTRVRLDIRADVTKDTFGFVRLESAPWGAGHRGSDVYVWGSPVVATGNVKPDATVNFNQAWIQHRGTGLLGIPAGVRVGHMPLSLGERHFFDHRRFGNDAILFFIDPTKEHHIGVWSAKFGEDSRAIGPAAADVDAYAVFTTYRLDKDNTVGAHYTLINDDRGPRDSSLQNLGLHARGKVAGLDYNGEVNLQFGDTPSLPETDYRGYGVVLGVSYKLDPGTIRFQYAYGSGDDNPADNKNEEFQTYLGNVVNYTFIYEYTTRGAGRDIARATGITNTTFYRLGFDFTPLKDVTASVDGFILRASEALVSKNIGNEVNMTISYRIDRNLTYSITAGFLDPGSWWVHNAGVLANHNETITQAKHVLTLTF